ncbi:MAG: LysR family transcriptional regulator [Muribaculaceae bacterium]|nr:LysR family transcriptional regulator [Muribaculaceae bacterium]MCM1480249.1 LysR family transcriptional regulator [Muribaculaceae bacterium]
MKEKVFINADEVAETLEISKPYAYKLVKTMNDELKQKGFITISGKVSRRYFEEKFYGLRGDEHACV